jgi:hypothetical protein
MLQAHQLEAFIMLMLRSQLPIDVSNRAGDKVVLDAWEEVQDGRGESSEERFKRFAALVQRKIGLWVVK